MTNTPIARIRLAPGQVGYFDEYSRIYLSITQPEADIYPGTNLYQIKRSLKSGRLRLIEGSLSGAVKEIKETTVKESKKVEEKIESVIQDEPVAVMTEVEKSEAEQVPEEVTVQAEEPAESKPKRSRRRKKTEEAAEQTEAVEQEAELEEVVE